MMTSAFAGCVLLLKNLSENVVPNLRMMKKTIGHGVRELMKMTALAPKGMPTRMRIDLERGQGELESLLIHSFPLH